MKKMVLHIPHASTDIPDFHGYVATEENIKNEIVKLTDWYTDELFENQTDDYLVAPFSRLFCDVERFPDDKDEVMAQYGMGALYTCKSSNKSELFRSEFQRVIVANLVKFLILFFSII